MSNDRLRMVAVSGGILIGLCAVYVAYMPSRLDLVLLTQAAITMVCLVYALRATGEERANAIHLALLGALAGPFGALVCFACAAARLKPRGGATIGVYARWVRRALADPRRALVLEWRRLLRDQRARIDGAADIRAFRDVLSENDQPAKIRALSVMSRAYRPEFAPALRLALNDTDPAVRVLAAGVLARLQERHGARIGALEERARIGAKVQRALAQAHFDFAESGVLSAERRNGHLARAHAGATALLDERPDDPAAHAILRATRSALGPSQQEYRREQH